MITKCSNPDCDSMQLSIGSHNGKFFLGCDECSETVKVYSDEEIVDILNDWRALNVAHN